jgi:hypothetical protein
VSLVTVAGLNLPENIRDDLKTSDYKNSNSSRQKMSDEDCASVYGRIREIQN